MKQDLYLVTVKAGSAYCLGTSPDDAWNKFKKWMDDNKYDFSSRRSLESIKRVATTDYFDSNLTNYDNINMLIL